MKKYVRAIICLMYSTTKFTLIKIFHFANFHFSIINMFSPFTEIDLEKRANLKLGNYIRARSGVKLKVRRGASLRIGNDTSFNHGCIVVCHDTIEIGDDVQFGPNVLVYDHDHDFRVKDGLKNLNYKTDPIIIGNNVWIGANVIILRGSVIGNNCIIGAGAIIKGNYDDNSVIIQKRKEIVKSH